MISSDSTLAIDVWNTINWTHNSKTYTYPWDYSNGNKFSEIKYDSLGRILSGTTFYFDGSVAMRGRLLIDPGELTSMNPLDADFEQVNYYPDGSIRMHSINSNGSKLALYYTEDHKLFHVDQITYADTISGIFLTAFNEEFNLEFSVYEAGKFVGKMLVDRQYNLIRREGFLSGKIAEEKHRVFIETLVKPYHIGS
jgi:hypothetical protein